MLLLQSGEQLADYIQQSNQDQLNQDIQKHISLSYISTIEWNPDGVSLSNSQHAHLNLVAKVILFHISCLL
jgi:hypothetical protein